MQNNKKVLKKAVIIKINVFLLKDWYEMYQKCNFGGPNNPIVRYSFSKNLFFFCRFNSGNPPFKN